MATGIDGRIINAVIARKRPTSPLVHEGYSFAQASERSDVDWRLLVAIALQETELGTTGSDTARLHNPFGLGPGIRFGSWRDAIFRAAEVIASYRADGLTTVAQVGSRWAPVGAANDPRNLNSAWVRGVTAHLVSLGGDPSNLRRADGGIGTIPGDAAEVAGDAKDAVMAPLDALGDLASRLTSGAWWIRVGMVVGGVAALGLGIVLIGRSVVEGQVG